MKTVTKKKFDCVKSVREQRKRIASDTEGMSPQEIITYFQNRSKAIPQDKRYHKFSSEQPVN
jgi:hypothetical protein